MDWHDHSYVSSAGSEIDSVHCISSSQFELVNLQLQQNLVEVLVGTLMTVEFVSLLASSTLSILHTVDTAMKDHQCLPLHKKHLYLQLIWL